MLYEVITRQQVDAQPDGAVLTDMQQALLLLGFAADPGQVVDLIGRALFDDVIDVIRGDTPKQLAALIHNRNHAHVIVGRHFDHVVNVIFGFDRDGVDALFDQFGVRFARAEQYEVFKLNGAQKMAVAFNDIDLKDVINRITSYNVCYTKLLRHGRPGATAHTQCTGNDPAYRRHACTKHQF